VKIAIVGTRGIPGRYGGFETFAEELSTRLVKRGHDVVVFGRTSKFPYESVDNFQGVRRVLTWTWFGKHVETPLSSLTAFLYLIFQRVDVIILCNAANSIFASIARIFGMPVIINVDGIERERSKWGILGRWWYRLGEVCSLLFGSKVVADAYSIGDYYAQHYGFPVERIVYGAHEVPPSSLQVLDEFGLERGKYILYVSRLEPENNALGVVQAYEESGVQIPLGIVGDAPYAKEYIERVQLAAGPRVIFTGYQFGDSYRALQSECLCYIQATEVGGTHPALIGAMAYGSAIIANGVPEHFEVLGGAGLYYPKNDFQRLGELMSYLVSSPNRVAGFGEQAKKRAERLFHWDDITESYEQICSKLLN
jgi:glycosyltransferase involved in cell wall biosynthesis